MYINQSIFPLVFLRFDDNLLCSQKSAPNDLVTETDQEVEKLLITGLGDKFPGSKFIGEESVAAGRGCVLTEEPTWIIDPIDGTTNFVSSNPNMCTILGYMVNKVTLLRNMEDC